MTEEAEDERISLNPHVVGRFFREIQLSYSFRTNVLIPMWWGGFSESVNRRICFNLEVLIPMWWGGFSESGGVFSLLNSNA